MLAKTCSGYKGTRLAGTGYGYVGALSGWGTSVLAILPDSSASEAGILPGWRIVSIDGQPSWMHQKREGRPAHFVFKDRQGHEYARELVVGPIPAVQFRESRILPSNLLYLHWKSFDDDTLQWLRTTLIAASEVDGLEGMVIDLRGNVGGLARVAAEVYAMLGGEDALAWRKTRRKQEPVGPVSPSMRYRGSLLVLVDAASISSAELVAARLQENGLAVLIGETTAGAVVASRDINLPDGGKLSIGMEEILTGDGQLLEGKGVTPKLLAPWTAEAIRDGSDPALEVVAMYAEELAKAQLEKAGTTGADRQPTPEDTDESSKDI